MIKMRRSIQMRCISLVHFVLNTGIMMTAWLLWCAPLIDTPDAQTMSLAICACYMVFSIFLFRTYNAYKIGIYRAGEVFYAPKRWLTCSAAPLLSFFRRGCDEVDLESQRPGNLL